MVYNNSIGYFKIELLYKYDYFWGLKMKKKVLHYVSSMNRGGQETFIMNVFRKINKEKVSFDFLCVLSEKGAYDDEIDTLGGKIYSLELGHNKIKVFDRLYAVFLFLKKHKNEYEAFHIHTQHAMDGYLNAAIAKKLGIKKVIVHSHSTSTLYHPFFHKVFKPLLGRMKIYRFACSNIAGTWLFGQTAKYEIIKNGIDVNTFSYSALNRKRIRLNYGWENYTVIGHVGSLTYPKNHEFILDVFKNYSEINPKAILVLIGDGPLKAMVEEKVKKLGLEKTVFLMGSKSNIYDFDQGMDLFLFPSHYEGLPVVLVEAQCTGLKCLISDVITPEIDVTRNIYRMPLSASALSWANRIDKIISELGNRQNMANTIRDAGFDIENTAEFLEKFYYE